MLLGILRASGVFTPRFLLLACISLAVFAGCAVLAVIRSSTAFTVRRHVRNLGRIGVTASNMTDQFDAAYHVPEGASTDAPVRIKALFIHPVKSCGAIEVTSARLVKTGFLYDRCFALAVQSPNEDTGVLQWRFLSQRTKPAMSQVKTQLWLSRHGAGYVTLTFDDPDPPTMLSRLETLLAKRSLSAKPEVHILLPLNPDECALTEFAIHYRTARGLDVGSLASVASALPKLRRFLNISPRHGFTIMKCTADTVSRTDKNLAPLAHIGTPSVHGYTDQQPVHINSLASVQALSQLLPPENQPLNGLKFRANVWITGAPAYDEESWKRYRIVSRNGAKPTLCVVCRTSRCTMPNVNLEKGTFDADKPPAHKKKGRPQPSTTLVECRTVETGNKAALGYLGMHCVPEDKSLQEGGVEVWVGDEIEVMERGVHLYGSTGGDY